MTDPDTAVRRAWKAFEASDGFAACRENVERSLWWAFCAGFVAGCDRGLEAMDRSAKAVKVHPAEPERCSAPGCHEPAVYFCASCDRPRCDQGHAAFGPAGADGDAFCDGERGDVPFGRCPA